MKTWIFVATLWFGSPGSENFHYQDYILDSGMTWEECVRDLFDSNRPVKAELFDGSEVSLDGATFGCRRE